jgi:2-dehydro-3-deoxy-D-arabinonate dehydratase
MPHVLLYRTRAGVAAMKGGQLYRPEDLRFDEIITHDDPLSFVTASLGAPQPPADVSLVDGELLAPITHQEVWAAGVTYFRSRDARMEESKQAGGDDFYARVYEADRPELFFKATPHRVAGPGQGVRIRRDSKWNVPEPELALVVNPKGRIVGYTIGNDMSSRDIEGENPLYLPQAKVYDASCALGPAILLTNDPLPNETKIELDIRRGGKSCYAGQTTLAQLKRALEELVAFLYRESSFPAGCILLTGTGVIPPADFTLHRGDEVRITIDPIGTLMNPVL